jgi:hypothetical protein
MTAVKLTREQALCLLALGFDGDKLMCKEVGQDDDWESCFEMLDTLVSDPGYQTFEIWP